MAAHRPHGAPLSLIASETSTQRGMPGRARTGPKVGTEPKRRGSIRRPAESGTSSVHLLCHLTMAVCETNVRVVVLGAGASKSYAQSPTGQRMPVSRDFFQAFAALPIYDNPWVLREALMGYIQREKCTDAEAYLRSGIDIEELHSGIQDRYFEAADSGEQLATVLAQRPYSELLFIFAAVVNAIQNGPISEAHRSIARLLRPTDVVITFNWDTLMDRALAELPGWNLDWGYGFAPHGVFRDAWQKPTASSPAEYVKLLKLHGSTNWLAGYMAYQAHRRLFSLAAAPGVVSLYEYATRPYCTYDGRYMPGYVPYSYGYYPPNVDEVGAAAPEGHVFMRVIQRPPWKASGTAGEVGLSSMPVIIPPVKAKTYDLFGSLFRQVWEDAERALRLAEHIVIIGYSFPRTDHRSNRLFMDSFLSRERIPQITIIDPSPERVRAKFVHELGIPPERIAVFREYFSSEFLLDAVLEE